MVRPVQEVLKVRSQVNGNRRHRHFKLLFVNKTGGSGQVQRSRIYCHPAVACLLIKFTRYGTNGGMSIMTIKGEFCTAKEAAEILGCTDAHVRRLLLDGKLDGFKFTEKSWAVTLESLRRYEQADITTGRPRKNSA